MKIKCLARKSIMIAILGTMIVILGGCSSDKKGNFEEALQKEIDKRVASGELAYPEETNETQVSQTTDSTTDEEEKLIAYDLKGNPVEIDGKDVIEAEGKIFYRLGGLYPLGEYVAVSDKGDFSSYYCVTIGPSEDIIVTNGSTENSVVFDTQDGEYISYQGCKLYPIDEAPEVEKTADGAYPASTYKVGTQIPAGEYVAKGNSVIVNIEADLTDDSDANLGIWGSNKCAVFKVEDGQYIQTTSGDIYPIELTEDLKAADGIYKDGMYKVGFHMPAGTYKLQADVDTAYAEIYNENTPGADREEVITAEPEQTFTVKEGQYVIVTGGRATLQ
ncbi:hypothetical protein [Cellulosilyticum lentocellum]|uniref:Lipoprotein n=1 Tax=Cellulosilyticum lentocellum (strain ATCC 49066 / DSM 5427 / NCIMB 11756 / RHM5) TaxID=642492 RepID=F2JM47_CELLD|nr:hypothetical protein [Cellulosilyticum lentocellum]ADZ85827.1 hypothetical protein Clole_4155 [Cellulosilyticum lentocellum DSM 5427]